MSQNKEKLVEVTAGKTFQCMKDGKPFMVVAGKTESIPESEAKAAGEAGLLKKPEAEAESKKDKK